MREDMAQEQKELLIKDLIRMGLAIDCTNLNVY